MSNSLSIIINLPEDFVKALTKEINDELSVAQRKWKVTLETKDKTLIRKAALAQLGSKVSSLSHSTWDLGDKLLINAAGGSGSMTLPKKFKNDEHSAIILNKKGWEITDEESSSSIPLPEFYDEFIRTLYTWVRTAVFYGVGSYASR